LENKVAMPESRRGEKGPILAKDCSPFTRRYVEDVEVTIVVSIGRIESEHTEVIREFAKMDIEDESFSIQRIVLHGQEGFSFSLRLSEQLDEAPPHLRPTTNPI
jgi:hypothetical protein